MGTHYQFTILDPKGLALTQPKTFLNGAIAMRVNEIGALTLPMPAGIVPQGFKGDYQILVERQPATGELYIENETSWFVQKISDKWTADGHIITPMAQDAKCLLDRRITAYATKTANVSISATPSDNAMKGVVRSNMGTTATDTARSWATSVPALTVEANTSQGVNITKDFAWRDPITNVLREMADYSAQQGTYLAFDVVKTLAGFEFRTYKGQRGTNRSMLGGFSPAKFGPQYGNLVDCEITLDYTDHVNYVYVGGAGEESNRQIVERQDAASIASVPFGRREGFRPATYTNVTASLQAEGDAYLREHRVKRIFTAKVVQTPATLYGVHYFLGDIITVDYYGTTFDCRIDAVGITLANGLETIDINLQTVLD